MHRSNCESVTQWFLSDYGQEIKAWKEVIGHVLIMVRMEFSTEGEVLRNASKGEPNLCSQC